MKRREFNKSQSCRIMLITGSPDYDYSGVLMRRETILKTGGYYVRKNNY